MSKQTWFLVAALVLGPATARAQAPASAAQAATSADAQARVDAALRTAVDAGIPVSLLQRKIAEGKAKGVAMERIAAAVEVRIRALVRAHEAMARARVGKITEGDLSIGANAMQAGVSDAALVTISRAAPPENRAVAIAVLTDLVILGNTSEHAVEHVEDALRHGPEALANLNAAATSEIQLRASSSGAAVQVDGDVGARLDVGGLPVRR